MEKREVLIDFVTKLASYEYPDTTYEIAEKAREILKSITEVQQQNNDKNICKFDENKYCFVDNESYSFCIGSKTRDCKYSILIQKI